MSIAARLDAATAAVLARTQGGEAPGKLAHALHYAVTPGGRADPADHPSQRRHGLR